MAVFEQDCLVLLRGDGCVKQHPQHCEEEEDDEEDLPVHGSNGHAVEGAAAHQSAAQDQDVDADDARQEPSTTMVGPLHHCLQMVDNVSNGLHTGGMGRTGQMLDVFHLCCHLNVGWVGLHNVIWCFSMKRTRREGVHLSEKQTNPTLFGLPAEKKNFINFNFLMSPHWNIVDKGFLI